MGETSLPCSGLGDERRVRLSNGDTSHYSPSTCPGNNQRSRPRFSSTPSDNETTKRAYEPWFCHLPSIHQPPLFKRKVFGNWKVLMFI